MVVSQKMGFGAAKSFQFLKGLDIWTVAAAAKHHQPILTGQPQLRAHAFAHSGCGDISARVHAATNVGQLEPAPRIICAKKVAVLLRTNEDIPVAAWCGLFDESHPSGE